MYVLYYANVKEFFYMFLLQVSPPLEQFLPGANDRPSFPLMPGASSGVTTQETVKALTFVAPLLEIIEVPSGVNKSSRQ